MATSGLLLTAFAAVHAWGNTKLFLGEEHFNAYARFLREVGTPIFPHSGLLWLTRLSLLLAAVAHVVAAWQLTRQGTTARPVAYARRLPSAAAFTAPVMRLSGLVIGVFVVYHVLHLTVGSAHPAFLPESPYRNTVLAFREWPAVLAYAAAMLALGAHLYHGITSAIQSLGLVFGPRSERLWRLVAVVVTVGVTGVNLLVPAAVLLGVVG